MAAVKPLRLNLLITTLTAFCAMPTLFAMAQPTEAKIEQVGPYETAVPGQMLSLTVIGLEMESTFVQIPLGDFRIDIVQQGVTFKAPVRSANPFEKRGTRSPVLKTGVRILFTVPKGLQEGEASLSLFYRGHRNGSAKLTIATRPLPPRFEHTIVAISARSRISTLQSR